jgi:hypothetical protein
MITQLDEDTIDPVDLEQEKGTLALQFSGLTRILNCALKNYCMVDSPPLASSSQLIHGVVQ